VIVTAVVLNARRSQIPTRRILEEGPSA
jgi:hypothetical protein